MRVFHWIFLTLNVFMLMANLFAGGSLWWVSVLGILFASLGLYIDSQTRKTRRRIRELNDAWTANWADRHGR